MAEQKGKVDCKTYHVFISHKSDCKPWVRILAQNLKSNGFNVFLDEWELVPGQSIAEGLYRGLKKSQKGILVVTPGAIESGWVKEEYRQMMHQKQENRDFSIIPVVLGEEIPDFPFLKDISWVDFRNPEQYRQSFYRLVCAIEGKPPGPDVELEGELIIPPTPGKELLAPDKDETAFVEELFELFFTKQAVILLAQADRWQGGVKIRLLKRAKKQYGENNVFHLVPPFGGQVDMKDYFSLLAKQCGFARDINGHVSMRAALEERLAEKRPLFLIVSGFENSCETGQEELSGVLRSLNERFPRDLKILICGGEKLADIAYSGSLSYLNQADIKECPEMTAADVPRFLNDRCSNRTPGIDIHDDIAKKLLDMSGGHPKVLETCYGLHRQNPSFTLEDLTAALVQAPFVWQLFMPFNRDPVQKQRFCHLLEQQVVGSAKPYIHDLFLKRLYWKNLIKRGPSNRHLYWRCEAVRLAGRQILECGNSHES